MSGEPEVTGENLPDRADPAAVAGQERLAEQVARTGMFGTETTGDTSGYGGLRVRRAAVPASPRPYGSYFDEVADQLASGLEREGAGFSEAVEQVVVERGELTLHVRREHLVTVAKVLRDQPSLAFEMCLGVSGVHYPWQAGRELHAVYPLLSITHNRRLRLEVSAPDARSPRAVAGGHLPDLRLARAGDLGFLRDHLRRSSGAHPDRDARRLEGPPAAEGLPARRDPCRIPRRDHTSPRRAKGIPVTAETEGRVYHVGGQDWDEVVAAADEAGDRPGEERLIVNMGPQHPSTHGVLRLVLTLEGETVTELRPVIGYLHTGIEKNMEFRTWTQGVTFCTRADYLSPLFNEAAYCLAVERLLGIEAEVPQRASVLRVLMMELNRISSHMTAIGTFGLELGATTVFLYGMREREKVLDLFELISGLRMNHAYIRPGGVSQDLPAGALEALREFLGVMPGLVGELRALLDANPVFAGRTKKVAYLDLAGCMALGVTGPLLRATGLPWDLRKSQPYCGYETYEFAVPTQQTCDAYGRYLIRVDEMEESLKIIEQCVDRLAAKRPAHDPVMITDAKIGWPGPARGRGGRAGELSRPHRPDHGPVDGGSHPSLQARHGGIPGARRAGLRQRGIPARGAGLPRRQRRRHAPLPGAPA